MEIRDNVFLITGGASGLGAATARLFVENGGKVVLADLNQDARALRPPSRRSAKTVRIRSSRLHAPSPSI